MPMLCNLIVDAHALLSIIMCIGDVIEGKKFEIACNIDGIPVPNVTWLKDNLPHLSVENTCVACNPAASVNMTIDIQVQASKSTGLIIITHILFQLNVVSQDIHPFSVIKYQEVH